MRMLRSTLSLFLLTASFFLHGCSSPPLDRIDLMPAPDAYANGLLNTLPETNPFDALPYDGILFATDRVPAEEGDIEKYYRNEPGYTLRFGLAEMQLGDEGMSWGYIRTNSMLKSRPEKIPIHLKKIEEWGILTESLPFWLNSDEQDPENAPDATAHFADAINAQLAQSTKKHVYIFVHGYKVTFENPLLVSAELWHFLGYNGAFIAYSWPSTPNRLAYIRDSDTAVGFARNLRLLLELLAEQTDAEAIHIIGYSNGTRLVARALEQLAMINKGREREEILARTRIGNVIFTGSDLDRKTMGIFIADGILNVARHTTIYVSEHDKAMSMARILTRRPRVGEYLREENARMSPQTLSALRDLEDRLTHVNVSGTEGAEEGNGHGYFRNSPWASSDILATLYFSMTPSQRGLVPEDGLPFYTFPPDYISRLWKSIGERDPAFAERHHLYLEQSGSSTLHPTADQKKRGSSN